MSAFDPLQKLAPWLRFRENSRIIPILPRNGRAYRYLQIGDRHETYVWNPFGCRGRVRFSLAAQQPLDADCSAAATQATGYTPGADTGPQAGGRVSGAAKGAAAGAAVGAVQGNQYDNASGRVQDANQENKAKNGAAAGMAVAGSRNRQDRRQGRQDQDAWQKSYDGCVAQKG